MKDSQVCQAMCNICVIWSPGLLIYAQGALIQRLRLCKIHLLIVQDGYVGQGFCNIGMLWSQSLLPGCQLSFICSWIIMAVIYTQHIRQHFQQNNALSCVDAVQYSIF